MTQASTVGDPRVTTRCVCLTLSNWTWSHTDGFFVTTTAMSAKGTNWFSYFPVCCWPRTAGVHALTELMVDCCGAEAALSDDDALNASSGSPSINGTSSNRCLSSSDSRNYSNFQFHTSEVCLPQRNLHACTSFRNVRRTRYVSHDSGLNDFLLFYWQFLTTY